MMRLVWLAIVLLVLGAIFRLVEGRRRHRWWKRDGGLDVVYWFVTPLVSKTGARLAVLLVGGLLVHLYPTVLRDHMVAFWHRQPAALETICLLVVGDFVGYWQHRLFHTGRWWGFHAVHHGSTELDWLSSVRLHPLNEAIGRGLEIIPLYLLGFDAHLLAAYLPFLTFYAVLVHADVPWDFGPLRTVIATPAFHRWHHTSDPQAIDKNFAGLFPLWDILFGTFYLPVGVEPQAFGISTNDMPPSLMGQLAYPFRSR